MAPPRPQKLAGLDYGRVRLGVAVSDDLGAMAHPRGALDASNLRALLGALRTLAGDETLEGFVLGLPLEMTGEEGPQARRVRAFAGELERATALPVFLLDERLTSVQATRRLEESDEGVAPSRSKRSKRGARASGRVDGAAAAVLLQSWLDSRRAH